MKLEEFKIKVNEFNKNDNVYKIVIDENFKAGTYKRMSIFPGIMVVPYIFEGTFVAAYYVNDFRLLPYLDMDMKSEGSKGLNIPSSIYKKLFKNKIKDANKILCSENIFYELKYLFDKRLVRDTDFYKQFKNKNIVYDEITKFINDNRLSSIEIKDDYLLVGKSNSFEGLGIKISDLFDKQEGAYFFNLKRNEILLDEKGLESLYDDYLNKLESYYNKKYLQCNTSSTTDKDIKSLISKITRTYNTTKHFNSQAKLYKILDSFSDIGKIKEDELESSKATLLLMNDKQFIEDIKISSEVVAYVKSILDREDCLYKVKSEEVDISSFAEFKGFVYEINHNKKDIKLLIDKDCSKGLYNKSKRLLGVIPYIVYLKDNNRLILCYTCFRPESLSSLIKYKNEDSKKKLTKNDLKKIAIYSYNHIESCIFRPNVYKTFKYLHKAGILNEKDLMIEGTGYKITNMRSLLSLVPLNHIVIKDSDLYFRLPGIYKQKDFKCKIKYDYDLKEFYTLLKLRLSSWANIDNLIGSVDFLSSSAKTTAFSEVCESMAHDTMVRLHRKQKIKSNIDTLEQMYIECKRHKHKNLLTDIFDNVIKGKFTDVHEAQLAKSINIERIKKEIKMKI